MIHEQTVARGTISLVEYRRDGVDTIYLLKPSDAAECDRIQNEGSKWRCIKASATAQRKKREGEDQ